MIDGIIAKYISANKRLVIPELGTLLRKESGELVFVELMRKDDGVLAAYAASEKGIGEPQAREAVAEYVAAVKKACADNGEYRIEGVGVLRKAADGTLGFESATDAATVPQAEEAQPVQSPAPEQKQEAVPTPPVNESIGAPKEAPAKTPQPKPAPRPRPTDAKTKKSKTDLILLIAIVAAVLALGAIVYGAMADEDPISKLRPTKEYVGTDSGAAEQTQEE